MDDLKRLIAFLFQRSGKDRMNEKDMYMILSFELGWMTPGEGRKIIEKAIEKGYITYENDEIIPNFDYKEIEIPLGFKYDKEKIDELEQDLFSKVVSRAVKELKIGEKRVREKIEKMARELDIYPEIAALLFAKKEGFAIEDLLEEAKNFLKERKNVI